MAWYFPWLRVVPEFQRAAVFRLGRIRGFRGPGLIWFSPLFERLVIVDQRINTVDVPRQECMSRDNVPIHVNAVVFFRVVAPDKAVVEVVDFVSATLQVAQTTVRSIVGEHSLDQLLTERDDISVILRNVTNEATQAWGVKIVRIELKDLAVPPGLKEAMAKEAAAERERRAMMIRATGEREAAAELATAAKLLDASPCGFKIRYLQALPLIAQDGNTVVFGAG